MCTLKSLLATKDLCGFHLKKILVVVSAKWFTREAWLPTIGMTKDTVDANISYLEQLKDRGSSTLAVQQQPSDSGYLPHQRLPQNEQNPNVLVGAVVNHPIGAGAATSTSIKIFHGIVVPNPQPPTFCAGYLPLPIEQQNPNISVGARKTK